jgi:hypothetical protein
VGAAGGLSATRDERFGRVDDSSSKAFPRFLLIERSACVIRVASCAGSRISLRSAARAASSRQCAGSTPHSFVNQRVEPGRDFGSALRLEAIPRQSALSPGIGARIALSLDFAGE